MLATDSAAACLLLWWFLGSLLLILLTVAGVCYLLLFLLISCHQCLAFILTPSLLLSFMVVCSSCCPLLLLITSTIFCACYLWHNHWWQPLNLSSLVRMPSCIGCCGYICFRSCYYHSLCSSRCWYLLGGFSLLFTLRIAPIGDPEFVSIFFLIFKLIYPKKMDLKGIKHLHSDGCSSWRRSGMGNQSVKTVCGKRVL